MFIGKKTSLQHVIVTIRAAIS